MEGVGEASRHATIRVSDFAERHETPGRCPHPGCEPLVGCALLAYGGRVASQRSTPSTVRLWRAGARADRVGVGRADRVACSVTSGDRRGSAGFGRVGSATGRVSFGSTVRPMMKGASLRRTPDSMGRATPRQLPIQVRPGRLAAARRWVSADCPVRVVGGTARVLASISMRWSALSVRGLRVQRRRGWPSSTAAVVARGDELRCGQRACRTAGSWGLSRVNRFGFGRGGVQGQVAENPIVRALRGTYASVGRPVDRLGCTIVTCPVRSSCRVVARWDTWDRPLRSHSGAAPKDREGGRPMRKHQAAAGRSESLKVGSSISHGETTKRMG